MQDGNWTNPTTWSPLGVPLPGDDAVINHTVTLDTDFAYSAGSITVSPAGGLLEDATPRNMWVNGASAAFNNQGSVTISSVLLSLGSFDNSGMFNAGTFANFIAPNLSGSGLSIDSLYNDGTFSVNGSVNITEFYNESVVNNNGIINVRSFYNNDLLNNFGTILGVVTIVDSMYNAGTFLNETGALLVADSCTNAGMFTNNGVVNFDQFTNEMTMVNNNYISLIDVTNTGDFTNKDSLIGGGSMTNTGTFDNQAGSIFNLDVSFLNANPGSFVALFNNDGEFNIGDSYYNFDDVTGSATGSITVQDTSFNSGNMTGSFDFCDMTPPPSAPFIDIQSGSVDANITFCMATGVDSEENMWSISIYPNPTKGIVYIEIDSEVDISVFNILGEKIFSTESHKLDFSNYKKGIYFLQLKDKNGMLLRQERIVKQ